MKTPKPRPPVWQQGASREYIANPTMTPADRPIASRRRLVVTRIIQAVLAALALAGLVPGSRGLHWPTFVILIIGWSAVLLDYTIRSRIRAQPTPSLGAKIASVVTLALLVAWIAWICTLTARSPSAQPLSVWIVTVSIGYALILATAFATQRGRYFAWRAEAVRQPDQPEPSA